LLADEEIQAGSDPDGEGVHFSFEVAGDPALLFRETECGQEDVRPGLADGLHERGMVPRFHRGEGRGDGSGDAQARKEAREALLEPVQRRVVAAEEEHAPAFGGTAGEQAGRQVRTRDPFRKGTAEQAGEPDQRHAVAVDPVRSEDEGTVPGILAAPHHEIDVGGDHVAEPSFPDHGGAILDGFLQGDPVEGMAEDFAQGFEGRNGRGVPGFRGVRVIGTGRPGEGGGIGPGAVGACQG
jgi:hypothetical protein